MNTKKILTGNREKPLPQTLPSAIGGVFCFLYMWRDNLGACIDSAIPRDHQIATAPRKE